MHRQRFDNKLSRLKTVTDPLNGPTQPTQFDYDPNNNLTKVTDAKLPTPGITNYTFDNMDRLGTRTDPLSKAESYIYDANGNLTVFRDRKLQATVFEYDALNRRTKATYADGSNTIYTYDAGNRPTQINDSTAGIITRTYDALDRLTLETTPQGTVTYTYDKASRRETMTVTGQPSSVGYQYDNANRLTQITQGTSIVQFGYDTSNRRTSLTLPNNVLVEYAYDVASRVTGIMYKQNGTTLIGDLTYEYDKAGNRTKTGGSWARTGMPEPITTTRYDANNRQLTFGDKTLAYDDNGNLQSITDSNGTTLYSWNARNQLVGISGPNVSASFVYDGAGRREKKTINGSLTEFLYDGINPVQETSGPTILANILPGIAIDEFLTRTDVVSGVTSYFLTDTLRSPVAVTDNAGVPQTEYTYESFGRTTVTGSSNGSSYQYTGRENDGTGLFYYRNRYYHPELSRFISEDPIEFAGGDVNLFAYVGNDPINHVDQLGLLLDGALSQALESAIQGSRAGPIGAAIGVVVSTVLGSTELGNPDREIIRPEKRPGVWVCKCRADCDDNKPGNCPRDPKERFKFGTWSDTSRSVAHTEACRLAIHRLGCKPKHPQVKCIGPNGQHWPT